MESRNPSLRSLIFLAIMAWSITIGGCTAARELFLDAVDSFWNADGNSNKEITREPLPEPNISEDEEDRQLPLPLIY